MCRKFLTIFSFIFIFSIPLFAGEVQTYSGSDLGSPAREGGRTVRKALLDQPIHSIEVRWKAKKFAGNRRATAKGWLFLDGIEQGVDQDIFDTWNYSSWEFLGTHQAAIIELGISRDDDDDSELQVDIDWVKITYSD